MNWVELAIFLVLIVSLIHFSQYFLWLVFALFAYRFWTLVLPFESFSNVIPFEKTSHYTVAIILLAAATYFAVMFLTRKLPFLKYVILVVMALYTLREYSISDVLLFKDYLEEKGMWSVAYWIDAVKSLFRFSDNPGGLWGVFESVGQKIVDGIRSFAHYIKEL